MTTFAKEVEQGHRFEFGKNWQKFLQVLNDERIAEAEKSLCGMLEVEDLKGKSFLDAGSGSGLFSLAAMRLGARKVHSFDYDPQSVACTRELKRRYLPWAENWTIGEGSVMDSAYVAGLGRYDIVYSWGVLHHTGNMWKALENVAPLVQESGKLFIAIYNSQVYWSSLWARIKGTYVRSPWIGKWFILACFALFVIARGLLKDLVFLSNPMKRYMDVKRPRGMSTVHDWIDWIGGYPFEVAKPEEIFDFYRKSGFILLKLKTCGGGWGNNEYVFQNVRNNGIFHS